MFLLNESLLTGDGDDPAIVMVTSWVVYNDDNLDDDDDGVGPILSVGIVVVAMVTDVVCVVMVIGIGVSVVGRLLSRYSSLILNADPNSSITESITSLLTYSFTVMNSIRTTITSYIY